MRTEDNVLEMRMTEGSAGYGVYVMLLELLRDSEERRLKFNPYKLAFAINETDKELVERVISNYNLLLKHRKATFRVLGWMLNLMSMIVKSGCSGGRKKRSRKTMGTHKCRKAGR